MEYLLSYIEKISNYYPLIVILLYFIYYIFSNSLMAIAILVIGIYLGYYLNNYINEKINNYKSIF